MPHVEAERIRHSLEKCRIWLRDLVLLDEIDEFVVHAWRPSLLPPTNGEPGCDHVACRGYGLGGVVISNRVCRHR
jgi:hypothetical protein